MELVEFLLARIERDEKAARAAQFNNGRWHRAGEFAKATAVVREFGPDVVPEQIGSLAWDNNGHIARWDPARVLAECDAKRRIMAEHGTIAAAYPNETVETNPCCETCSAGGEYPGEFPCATLRLLALPYADHEDYRDEWKP